MKKSGKDAPDHLLFSEVAAEVPDPQGTRRGLFSTVTKMVHDFPERVNDWTRQHGHHYAVDAFRAYADTCRISLRKELLVGGDVGWDPSIKDLGSRVEHSCVQCIAWVDGGCKKDVWLALRPELDSVFEALRTSSITPSTAEVLADLAAVQLQLIDFLRKSTLVVGGPSFTEKAADAWTKTLETEKLNGDTNARLKLIWAKFSHCRETTEDEALTAHCLEYIRAFVERHLRNPRFDQLADDAGFGPGTTVTTNRDIIEKISSRKGEPLNCNEALLPYAGLILTRYFPGWARHLAFGGFSPQGEDESGIITFSTEHADEKFSSVLKSWDKNRPIGIQSTLQGFLQTAIGTEFERVCRRMGNPIKQGMHEGKWIEDPQALNRARAVVASITGDDCTVDFSSASELICTVLVRWVFDGLAYRGSDSWASASLAQKWGKMLDLLRSRTLANGDHVIVLERFSATGNGFTFPLMTMIMLGLGRFCQIMAGEDPRSVRVFGDDLIVSSKSFQFVERVSALLGFRVNREKSYHDGAFRESCGVNAFAGVDITPFRISGAEDEELTSVTTFVAICNGLYRGSCRGVRLRHHSGGLLAARVSVLRLAPRILVRVLASVDDCGDNRIAGFSANDVVRNPLSSLYWRGIGLTPILVRRSATKRMEDMVRVEANWAHKAYSSFIYNTRTSPRSIRGSFQVHNDDLEEAVVFVPGLCV